MFVSQTYVVISYISMVFNLVTFSYSVSPDLNCSQAREVSFCLVVILGFGNVKIIRIILNFNTEQKKNFFADRCN